MRNYILIYDWMTSEMKLKGNELLVYGIIYRFSLDGDRMMKGGIKYICKFLNLSKPAVIKLLSSLVQKGYIERVEVVDNTCKRVYYRITETKKGGI